MSLFNRLRGWLAVKPVLHPRTYPMDEDLLLSLHTMAAQEQRASGEMASRLIGVALHDCQTIEHLYKLWDSLSLREQEVTALICQGSTTRQIASQLNVSPSTVKTHVHNLLVKYGLYNRQQLRLMLVDWDFDRWVHERWG